MIDPPIIIAEWPRNSREVVRVSLSHYGDRDNIDVRIWYFDGEELKPSKSGITLAIEKHLIRLNDAVSAATARAIEMKLVEDQKAGGGT